MYNVAMKQLKKIFYGIMIFIMLGCAGVLILAFSPDQTRKLSAMLYGEEGPEAYMDRTGSGREGEDVSGADAAVTAPQADGGSGIADGVLASEERAGYVAPVRGSLNLPDQVSGRNGYQPVSSRGEELDDDQADALGTAAGATGDGLEFSAEVYPYYHMLNGTTQHIYRQIYANAMACNDTFAPLEAVTPEQLKNVFEAVYNDHPEIFWLDTEYECKYRPGGQCVEVKLSYNRTAQDLSKAKSEFEAAARPILNGAASESSDQDKEKYVHDELLKKAEYVASSAMNQSAYSALVDGDTVCAGYSRAFQYLMQQLGIPCYYCTGYVGEDHAWNIVKVDGAYYNVDVTWDDTDPSTYDYYNKTDADYVGTHVRTGLSVYLPACGESGDGETDDYLAGGTNVAGITLNPNPQQPLTWEPREKKDREVFVSGGDTYDMGAAGVTSDMVQKSLKDYYENCLEQMKDRGSGQQAFSNVVPKYVLDQVEKAYGTGDYEKGYVNEGLKDIGVENFAIQIQVRDLGGNYYRLYHNINTW